MIGSFVTGRTTPNSVKLLFLFIFFLFRAAVAPQLPRDERILNGGFSLGEGAVWHSPIIEGRGG
jgi:hypothetical protein